MGILELTGTKTILCALIISMSFLSTLPVIGSISFTESSSCSESSGSYDVIDANMAFLLFPREVSVKVNDTFVIQVGVENATDMFGWEVCLRFNPWVLECVSVSPPFSHVFSYALTAGAALVDYNATEFTNPLYRIHNNEGWMLAGNCLLGANQSTFNGSGTVCQIEFKAISPRSSTVKLHLHSHFESYVLDSKIRAVKPSSTVNCHVTCLES